MGARVRWPQGGLWGFVSEINGPRLTVRFDNGVEQQFTFASGVIKRYPFDRFEFVMDASGNQGVIAQWVNGQPEPTWMVVFAGGTKNIIERGLRSGMGADPAERMRAGKLDSAADFNLRSVTADFWYSHLHDELVSLAHARVDLKPHQVSVTHRVVSSYPYRFLLCDEVGLGKTIEAAMVIKELRARKLAARVLIIVPSGLQRQWQFELKTKFNETFAILNRATVASEYAKGITNPWSAYGSVITSQSWASYNPDRIREITSVDWDLVIVDEAHHARHYEDGGATKLYGLVHSLTSRPEFARRGVLFLTATPLQLTRHELFALVEMVNPVLFASEQDFVDHVEELSGLNQAAEELSAIGGLAPNDRRRLVKLVSSFLDTNEVEIEERLDQEPIGDLVDDLRSKHRLSEVMIRNRRRVIGGFQPRSAYRIEVELAEPERLVQQLIEKMVEEGYRSATGGRSNTTRFLMVMWQKLAASSSNALAVSLRGRRGRLIGPTNATLTDADAEELLDEDRSAMETVSALPPAIADEVERLDELISVLDRIEVDSKTKELVIALKQIFSEDPGGKVIVFTEFRETQEMLATTVEQAGWGIHKFHGQLGPIEKDRAIDQFRDGSGPQILVSTEAGGEGRNFQFAHILVNYDLPWNPMRIEQRIGRVDRIGQDHPVRIFNFHVNGTIESRVLEVLENRIQIFQESVGGLDPILGEAETNIRTALRLPGSARDAALDEFAEDIGRKVAEARRAEEQLQDFILDTKSYSAEIAQSALGEEQPINQSEFELFMTRILASVNTWVGNPNKRGEYEIQFHPPFTEERKHLLDGIDHRRVCLDPRSNVDSEYVEYLGFGHPIVDSLVERTLDEEPIGLATIRSFKPDSLGIIRPGWQFNWAIKVGGIRPAELIHPVFVSDEGDLDPTIGEFLLHRSREFEFEENSGSLDDTTFESAFKAAQSWVGVQQQSLVNEHEANATERAKVDMDRIEKLFENRLQAAQDKIASVELTLQGIRESQDPGVMRILPVWEANHERAEREQDLIDQDRITAVQELRDRQNITAEFRLLNIARIELVTN